MAGRPNLVCQLFWMAGKLRILFQTLKNINTKKKKKKKPNQTKSNIHELKKKKNQKRIIFVTVCLKFKLQ